MYVNVNSIGLTWLLILKTCCLRIGPRLDVVCAKIASVSGCVLSWVSEIKYLGVYIVNSRSFKCSVDAARHAFYRSANAIFGKIGRIASEEVTLQLIQSKSVPLLLYGLEACPLNKSQLNSLDFVINRFFIYLFYLIIKAKGHTGHLHCSKTYT